MRVCVQGGLYINYTRSRGNRHRERAHAPQVGVWIWVPVPQGPPADRQAGVCAGGEVCVVRRGSPNDASLVVYIITLCVYEVTHLLY